MNYKVLFTDNDTLQGGNFTCTLHRHSRPVTLTRKGGYPVLFVLSGNLTLFCNGKERVLPAGEMVIADREQITGGFCLPDTILLEYTLPETLTARFGAFPEPMTPSIPITGRLETWVEDLLLQRPCKAVHEEEQLIGILVRFQSHRLRKIGETMRFYLDEMNGQRHNKKYLFDPENSAL